MSGKMLRLLPFLVLGYTTPVFAAEGGEGGLLSVEPGMTLWTIITFVVVLAILWKAALPPILGAVEAREQQIRDLLAAAAADRQAAQEAKEQHTRQLDETRSRVQELVAEGKLAGERVRDEIIANARAEANEIVARARRDVRQELDAAVAELRAEAVDLALAAASKLVERNLDADDNRRLVRDYLAALESDGRAVPAGV